MNHDPMIESAKAVPPTTAVALHLFGVQISDVLILVTLVYTIAQLFFLLRDKWWRPRRDARAHAAREAALLEMLTMDEELRKLRATSTHGGPAE